MRLPDLPVTTKQLRADVSVRMREPGGRAVEQTASLPIEATQPMLGIKAEFDYGAAPEGQPAAFKLIAVDKAGKQHCGQGRGLDAEAPDRATGNGSRPMANGAGRASPAPRRSPTASSISPPTSPPILPARLSWGEYRLEIAADGMTPASIDFSAGYYYGDTSKADTPDTLKVALDTTDTKTGGTVNVKIEARYAGKATVQIVGDRLLSQPDGRRPRRWHHPALHGGRTTGAPAPMCWPASTSPWM